MSKGDASLASGLTIIGDRRREHTIASCIRRISHRTMHGRHASKNIVLITPAAVSACATATGAMQSGRTVPWFDSKTAVQAEHRLNLARQIVEMVTRIDRRFLATSDPIIVRQC